MNRVTRWTLLLVALPAAWQPAVACAQQRVLEVEAMQLTAASVVERDDARGGKAVRFGNDSRAETAVDLDTGTYEVKLVAWARDSKHDSTRIKVGDLPEVTVYPGRLGKFTPCSQSVYVKLNMPARVPIVMAAGETDVLLDAVIFRAFQEDPRRVVVVLGDSITEGGVRPDGYVTRLNTMSDRVLFVGQGRGGWATTTYLGVLPQILVSVRPDADVVMLQLGSNDLWRHGHTEATVRQAAENMARMADACAKHLPGVEIVLVGPPPIFPKDLTRPLTEAGFGQQTPAYLRRLSAAYRQLAQTKGYRFVDLGDVVSEGNTTDGAHPSGEGHAEIAEAIWAAVAEFARIQP